MKRYSVISAMDMRDFIDRVNMAIRTVGAEPVGGVSTQGAQFLQAVLIDIPDTDDEEESPKSGEKAEAKKTKTRTKKN